MKSVYLDSSSAVFRNHPSAWSTVCQQCQPGQLYYMGILCSLKTFRWVRPTQLAWFGSRWTDLSTNSLLARVGKSLLPGTPTWSAPVWEQVTHGSSEYAAPKTAAARRTAPIGLPWGTWSGLKAISRCRPGDRGDFRRFFLWWRHLPCPPRVQIMPLCVCGFFSPLCTCFYSQKCNCGHMYVIIAYIKCLTQL